MALADERILARLLAHCDCVRPSRPPAIRRLRVSSRRFSQGDRVACAVEDASGDYSDWAAGTVQVVDYRVDAASDYPAVAGGLGWAAGRPRPQRARPRGGRDGRGARRTRGPLAAAAAVQRLEDGGASYVAG